MLEGVLVCLHRVQEAMLITRRTRPPPQSSSVPATRSFRLEESLSLRVVDSLANVMRGEAPSSVKHLTQLACMALSFLYDKSDPLKGNTAWSTPSALTAGTLYVSFNWPLQVRCCCRLAHLLQAAGTR